MDKENSFASFYDRVNVEWSLIVNCKTNSEFISLVADRLLDFFRNDPVAKKGTIDWDAALLAEYNLRRQGCRELSDAVEEIRSVCRMAKKPSEFNFPSKMDKEQDSISTFTEMMQSREQSKHDDYTLRMIEKILEIVRSEGYCINLEEAPVFWDWNGAEDWSVYDQLGAIYRLKISKNRLTFAPSAFQLTVEGVADVEYPTKFSPALYSWKKLVHLAEYWSYRHEVTDDERWWPQVEGDGLELWLKADHVRQRAFTKMIASRLKFVDESNFDKNYFNREDFQKKIQRLFCDIIERFFPKDYEKLKKASEIKNKKGTHPRTQKHIADKEALTRIGIQIWHREIVEKGNNPESISNGYIVKLLKKYVNQYGIPLNNPSENLFDVVVKKTSPRIFIRGKFCGLKSSFQ